MGDEYTCRLIDEDGNSYILNVKAENISFTNNKGVNTTLDELMQQIDTSMEEIENAKEYVDTGLHNIVKDYRYFFDGLADYEVFNHNNINSIQELHESLPVKSELRLSKGDFISLGFIVPSYIENMDYRVTIEKNSSTSIKKSITTIDNVYKYESYANKDENGIWVEGAWINLYGNFANYNDDVIRDVAVVSLENRNVVPIRSCQQDDSEYPFPASSDNVYPTLFDSSMKEIYKGFPYEIVETTSANGHIPIRTILISEPGIYTLDGRYTVAYSTDEDEIFTTQLFIGDRQINDIIKLTWDKNLSISNIAYVNIPHTTFVVKPEEPVGIQMRYINNNYTKFITIDETLFHLDITRIGNYYPSAINYK